MKSFKGILKYIRPYWKTAVIAPFLMVLEVCMDLLQPRLMTQIVDVGVANLDLNYVLRIGLWMILVAVVGMLGGVGNTILSAKVAMFTGADMRGALFRKVQSLSFANLDRHGAGELVTRLTNDITQIQEVILIFLRILVRAPMMVIGSLVMAILTSPRLSWLLVVMLPIIVVILAWGIQTAYPIFGKVQKMLDRLNTVMQENLAGVRVVKAFVRGDHEIHRFKTVNNDLVETSIHVAQLMSVIMPLIFLAMNLGVVGVVWFGGLQVIDGDLKVGQVMAFINYISQMLFSMLMVGMLMIRVSRARASADRIQEVLDSEPYVVQSPEACAPVESRGRVVFENVTFRYDESADPVLKDVSITGEPGQLVAILGATGSGKSSLVHLIPRFYDVTEGRVSIDGVDVRDWPLNDLRHSIGIALQETVLFSGTIRDNIRYGKPDAGDEEVFAAARAAQAHDFISGLPEGYDTQLGQRGVNLSGGQKQRIAIARALLTHPRILILDDSTSAVDVDTEARIQDALAEIMRGRTSFVIAQRISTVLNADKIIVLDEGQVVAEGVHRDLMRTSPIYREIYDLQLGNGVSNG